MKATIYKDEIPLAYGLSSYVDEINLEPIIEVTKEFYKKVSELEAKFFEMQNKLEKLYTEARKKKIPSHARDKDS